MMRGIGNLAAVCAAVAICYGMQHSKPRYADLIAPMPTRGKMQEVVRTLRFDVRVDQVTFAKRLKVNEFGKEKMLTSGGLWAIVLADLAAADKTTTVAGAVWQGPTGLRYMPSGRLNLGPPLPPHLVDPGLPKKGLFLFEVPADQVRGATLLVSSARNSALDAEARIALDEVELRDDGMPETFVMTRDLNELTQEIRLKRTKP
jgi:hypothetical protein